MAETTPPRSVVFRPGKPQVTPPAATRLFDSPSPPRGNSSRELGGGGRGWKTPFEATPRLFVDWLRPRFPLVDVWARGEIVSGPGLHPRAAGCRSWEHILHVADVLIREGPSAALVNKWERSLPDVAPQKGGVIVSAKGGVHFSH